MSATNTHKKFSRKRAGDSSDRHAGPRVMLTFSDEEFTRLRDAASRLNIKGVATYARKLVLDALAQES